MTDWTAPANPALRPGPGQGGLLFGALSQDDARTLRTMGRPVRFPARRTFFIEGEEDSNLLIIETGRVEISLNSAEGRRRILAQLGPGAVVGEMAALDGRPRSTTATAAVDVTGRLVDRAHLLRFLETRPRAAIAVMQAVCARLRLTVEVLSDRTTLEAGPRLARCLERLFVDWGKPDKPGEIRMEAGFSQTDLGDMCGLTRETVNRHLRRWETDGILRRDGASFVLLDPAGLAVHAHPMA
ncbi:Crp/Fnr family transcriptional regulator [Citreimonas salinaria]|uniref:cAMP-binding domain of CRP or a regulatory subunit of cAMP-dependent protein kinases n=1 Tax=Citreimonas salinaria TaxID=321339 RepID=A0A1H3HZ74_9RHOB|nr:Crp/Fnr family transcriptional regulator [Citreimonas salinaria]SDY20119.1 cAMP-binding domain of CRP or a regulatory subunit of cAMP-dependent protein kinases [Citreimonas salinaria]